ncbi:MAG: hypothetical protein GXP36_09155 [Actinobacteria bacterium]|nr:hypothetical protein [Actinomycetota bacterium]
MRIAIEATDEVGRRAARILLNEFSLLRLGLVSEQHTVTGKRVERATDLATYDVLVTDAADPRSAFENALDANIDCVAWRGAEYFTSSLSDELEVAGRSLVINANLGQGIGPALAGHEIARGGEVLDVEIAWTEPGRSLRRGTAVPFPEPVGARWGRTDTDTWGQSVTIVPIKGIWAAAMARVTTAGTEGVSTRVVGVSDQAAHLEALSLAAAAAAAASGAYPMGRQGAADIGDSYLHRAIEMGLDIAFFSYSS